MKYLVKLAYAIMVEAVNEADAEETALETIGDEAPTKIAITEMNEKVPFPPEELKTPQEQLSFYEEYYFDKKTLKYEVMDEVATRVEFLISKHPELEPASKEILSNISFGRMIRSMANAFEKNRSNPNGGQV